MDRYTIKPALRKEKVNSKGECPVVLIMHSGGRRWVESLGFSIPEAAWDAVKGRIRTGYPNARLLNDRIQKASDVVETNILEGQAQGVAPRRLRQARAATTNFYEFAETVFKEMESKGQHVTANRYRNNLPSIRSYAGEAFPISDINAAWLKGYETHCRNQKSERSKAKKAISQNTIWSRFKMLRKMLLIAADEKLIPRCPIGSHEGGYPMPTYEEVPKDYLTYEEVTKLADKLGHPGFTPAEDTVLSFFLIECTAGIRHSDWSRFTVEKLLDGPALKVRQTRKTGAPIYVPIQPGTILARTMAHIEDRGYKYEATESAYANRVLKVIAKVAGISKPMTTHTGRHTCCTLLLERGFTRESVAEVIGVSMNVVDTYAKMTRQKIRNEFDKLGGL